MEVKLFLADEPYIVICGIIDRKYIVVNKDTLECHSDWILLSDARCAAKDMNKKQSLCFNKAFNKKAA